MLSVGRDVCFTTDFRTQLHRMGSMYLSMILGANFESKSGPEIPLNVSLLNTFGGHVTMKKGTTWLLIIKKGATCGISPPLLAPTESPKRFPNRSFPRRCRGSPGPTACPTSAAARYRVPDSRCGLLFQGHAKSRPRRR